MAASLEAQTDEAAAGRVIRYVQGHKPGPGSLEVFSLSDYPAPPAVKQRMAEGFRQRSAGPTLVAGDQVPDQRAILAGLGSEPATPGDAAHSVRSVSASPWSDLSRTVLMKGVLLSTRPAGVISARGSSGLSRTFQLEDGSLLEFSEDDYVAAGTRIRLVKEAFNTEVNGTPGVLSSARTEDGRGRSMLHWVTSTRSYRLVRVAQKGFEASESEALLINIAERIPD